MSINNNHGMFYNKTASSTVPSSVEIQDTVPNSVLQESIKTNNAEQRRRDEDQRIQQAVNNSLKDTKPAVSEKSIVAKPMAPSASKEKPSRKRQRVDHNLQTATTMSLEEEVVRLRRELDNSKTVLIESIHRGDLAVHQMNESQQQLVNTTNDLEKSKKLAQEANQECERADRYAERVTLLFHSMSEIAERRGPHALKELNDKLAKAAKVEEALLTVTAEKKVVEGKLEKAEAEIVDLKAALATAQNQAISVAAPSNQDVNEAEVRANNAEQRIKELETELAAAKAGNKRLRKNLNEVVGTVETGSTVKSRFRDNK